MTRIHIVVPVAPFEPLSVIERSVECLSQLETEEGMQLEMTYVLDKIGEDDLRAVYLARQDVNLMLRPDNRGRRAGAINDAIASTSNADYFAFFDVDSRPDPDFLIKCLETISSEEDAVVASGTRYITNEDENLLTKIIAAEYVLIRDVFRLFNWSDSYKHFNGIIGLVDAKVFEQRSLDEDWSCEDVQLMQDLYLEGYTAVFNKRTRVGEQAATRLTDLYKQQIRWYTGAIEALSYNRRRFLLADIRARRKITWLISMLMPFTIVLLIPLLPGYVFQMQRESKGIRDFLVKFFGIIPLTFLLECCGIVAIVKWMRKSKVEWGTITRTGV